MKRLLGMMTVITVVALAWAAGAEAARSTPTANSIPMLSQIDVMMIEIEDLDGWMASHRSRTELREMNRGMRSVCEELRNVESYTYALAQDRQFLENGANAKTLRSLQASMSLLTTELNGWQNTMRTLATQGTPSEPASGSDREKCQSAGADLAKRMAALEAGLGEVGESMTTHGGRSELSASAVSLAAALNQLGPVVRAMDRLNEDPALDQNCLSQLRQAQERLSGVVQQIESCRECLAGMTPKS